MATPPSLGHRTSPRAGLAGAWAILPLGSCEAHGPHLPLDTDVVISVGMAEAAVSQLGAAGVPAVALPPLGYGVTHYAGAFPGTLSIPAELVVALIVEVGAAAVAGGAVGVALANSHFEPAHIDALFEAARRLRERVSVPVVYPNVASRRYAPRLGAEFESGACHAGSYETSLVLAASPEHVDEAARRDLPEVPIDLAAAMRAGARDFVEAGGTRAYFGAPAAGSPEQGRALYTELGRILVEAIGAARR